LMDWGTGKPVMIALLSDGLWQAVEPLLPAHPRSPKGGRKWRNDRECLEGILYVLRGGIPWHLLPEEFGVSPSTCWRRFHAWSEAGVWDQLHRKLLCELGKRGKLDTSRVVIDSASVRALKGGRTPAPIR
jgi:transposase